MSMQLHDVPVPREQVVNGKSQGCIEMGAVTHERNQSVPATVNAADRAFDK